MDPKEKEAGGKAGPEPAAAGGAEEPSPTPADRDRKVVPFDPRKPSRLNRKQMENLKGLFSSVLDGYAEVLGKDFRCNLEVELTGVSQESCDRFLDNLHPPVCLYRVHFKPWKPPALIFLDHVFVFSGVDRFLGGSGAVEIEPRELTDVEGEITNRFVATLSRCTAAAWKKVVALEPVVGERVSDPDKLDPDGLEDVLLVVTFRIRGPTSDFGSFTVCIPFGALEGHLERIGNLKERAGTTAGDPAVWRRALAHHLDRVEVGLPVILGETEIPLGEIADLEEGDVIVLDKGIHDPVRMSMGGRNFITGTVGVHNDRLAMKIRELEVKRPVLEEGQKDHG